MLSHHAHTPAPRPLAALGLAVLLALTTAQAGAASYTLQRIAETGTVNLGHRESSVPFSYYDNRHQVAGYSHELMLKVVEALKA